jgi:hypothetical protein
MLAANSGIDLLSALFIELLKNVESPYLMFAEFPRRLLLSALLSKKSLPLSVFF